MGVVGRILGALSVALLCAVLLYTSRFWNTPLWDRDGAFFGLIQYSERLPWPGNLFGVEALPPNGDVVTRQLGDLGVGEFGLVAWGVAAILLLSLLHWLGAGISGLIGKKDKGA